MAAEHQEHREQTLMFSDIVGYSRLMGRDEALTIEMLGDYRKILLAHIAEHDGVFIEFAGDAIFSRFDTAHAAVNAAVAIQKHLQLFNQDREKDLPRLQTRIGIHKGAVLVRGDAVLGDDVNIAARLEPLAVADGICISKAVYDDIRTDLREPIKPLGVQSLKNIQHKVRAYLIKPTGLNWRDHFHYFWRGCAKKMEAYRYPISVSVLVLIAAGFYFIPRWLVPGYAANYVEIANFQNLMNADGKSDYFSSGITEAVRSQLADMRDVYIVEADKGIHAPIRLEGSVQKIGDNLRIVYRIFRREGNVQIAGGKLDGAYQDIFILQDRLVGEIAKYLANEFKLQNFRPAPLKLTNDITAYDYYLQGMEYLSKPPSHENADGAIQRFNTALIHDPNFSLANAGLCNANWQKYVLTNTGQWLNDAENHCLLALKQDETSAKTYTALGIIFRDTGRYEKAIEYLEKSKTLDPDDVYTSVELASVYSLNGNPKTAEAIYKKTLMKSPKSWIASSGYGHFLMSQGRYDEAIQSYKKSLKIVSTNVIALNNLAACYIYKDNFKKAAAYFEDAANIEPSGSIFGNIGNMYYLSGDFDKAQAMFLKALNLEPTNYEWMVNIADTYNNIPNKKMLANQYYKNAIIHCSQEIKASPQIAKSYQYLARALAATGDVIKAKETILYADGLDNKSIDSIYAHLRISIKDHDDENIKMYFNMLLKTDYSEKLILADPEFSILRNEKFRDVTVNKL